MACQGCGLTSNARLCCPTCIEYGRTSFFCGQECFTKNWASHSQLHELLKKKKVLAQEEGGGAGSASSASSSSAAADGGDATSASSGASQRPRASAAAAAPQKAAVGPRPAVAAARASQDAPSGLRGPRGPAPLPGGTSLVNNLRDPGKRPPSAGAAGSRGAAAAQAHKKDAAAASGGVSILGSIVGRLASAVRSRPAGAEGKPPPGASAAADRPEKPAGRAGPAAAAQPKATHGRNMRRFAVQAMLWCLAVVVITAGGITYRESLRIEQPGGPGQLAEATEAVVAAAAAGAPASDGGTGGSEVQSLRSEVAALRERLERHDKMLRYIMDRYVEKNATESGGPAGGSDTRAFEAHEASSAAFDMPAALRGAGARAGDSARKRKGGGTDASASVGLPIADADRPVEPEIRNSSPPAAEAGPPTAKADIGAVAPEGSRAVRAKAEA